jgi:hypothetical protein
MCGAIGAEAYHSLNLKRADTLLAGQHEVHDLEPLPQRLVGVLEDGPGDMREAVTGIWHAFVALPLERHRSNRKYLVISTPRATDTLWPAARYQILGASFLIRESLLKLRNRHLMNWLGALHGQSSFVEGYGHQVPHNRLWERVASRSEVG